MYALTTEQIHANLEAEKVASNIKKVTTATFVADYEKYLQGDQGAALGIIEQWEVFEADGLLSVIRATYSRASKKLHKELGVNMIGDKAQGLVVKDGALALAAVRERKDDTSELMKLAAQIDAGNDEVAKAGLIEAMKAHLEKAATPTPVLAAHGPFIGEGEGEIRKYA
jgi:hypothetical protein